jgi:hypothetical protein
MESTRHSAVLPRLAAELAMVITWVPEVQEGVAAGAVITEDLVELVLCHKVIRAGPLAEWAAAVGVAQELPGQVSMEVLADNQASQVSLDIMLAVEEELTTAPMASAGLAVAAPEDTEAAITTQQARLTRAAVEAEGG